MNRATRMIVATLGVLLGLSGMNHGFFEALQGNTATPGLFVQSIGPANRMWRYGTEDAFTLIPNFLVTGLLAMSVGLLIVIWSVGFVHKPSGPRVFILLFVLLFLVGGGVAQVVLFTLAWAMALQINRPLTWWRQWLSANARAALGRLWTGALTLASLLLIGALAIAVAGFVPGVNDPWQKELICWSFLAAGLGLYLLTFAAGFAHDSLTVGASTL